MAANGLEHVSHKKLRGLEHWAEYLRKSALGRDVSRAFVDQRHTDATIHFAVSGATLGVHRDVLVLLPGVETVADVDAVLERLGTWPFVDTSMPHAFIECFVYGGRGGLFQSFDALQLFDPVTGERHGDLLTRWLWTLWLAVMITPTSDGTWQTRKDDRMITRLMQFYDRIICTMDLSHSQDASYLYSDQAVSREPSVALFATLRTLIGRIPPHAQSADFTQLVVTLMGNRLEHRTAYAYRAARHARIGLPPPGPATPPSRFPWLRRNVQLETVALSPADVRVTWRTPVGESGDVHLSVHAWLLYACWPYGYELLRAPPHADGGGGGGGGGGGMWTLDFEDMDGRRVQWLMQMMYDHVVLDRDTSEYWCQRRHTMHLMRREQPTLSLPFLCQTLPCRTHCLEAEADAAVLMPSPDYVPLSAAEQERLELAYPAWYNSLTLERVQGPHDPQCVACALASFDHANVPRPIAVSWSSAKRMVVSAPGRNPHTHTDNFYVIHFHPHTTLAQKDFWNRHYQPCMFDVFDD